MKTGKTRVTYTELFVYSQLLHPLGENSPISSFLQKNPSGGMHHICIEVDDIAKAIQDVKDKVRPLTSEPKVGVYIRTYVLYIGA